MLLPHLIASVFNLNSCIPLAKWMLFPNFICSVSGLGSGAVKLYSICCSHQNCAVKSLTLRYPIPHLNLSRGGRNSLDEIPLSVPSSFSLSPVDLTSNEQNKITLEILLNVLGNLYSAAVCKTETSLTRGNILNNRSPCCDY